MVLLNLGWGFRDQASDLCVPVSKPLATDCPLRLHQLSPGAHPLANVTPTTFAPFTSIRSIALITALRTAGIV